MNRIVVGGVLVSLLLGSGCKKVEQALPEELPDVTLPSFPLPKSAAGAYELLKVAGSELQLDPTQSDPISAVGRCADLVTGCYEKGQPLDACVEATRRCGTDEPWKERDDCCPGACADAYAKERKANPDALAALEKVFFLEPGCFPGVVAAIGGTP